MDIQIIADGITRQVARVANLHHHKSVQLQWSLLKEHDVVRCVQAVFDGLGYATWLESSYPKTSSQKLDLVAYSPGSQDPAPTWRIEVKSILDHALGNNHDNRLNVERFRTKKEISKDFEQLDGCADATHLSMVVWAVFSDSPKAQVSSSNKVFRLADAIDEIRGVGGFELAAHNVLDVVPLADVGDFPYVHVLLWTRASEHSSGSHPWISD